MVLVLIFQVFLNAGIIQDSLKVDGVYENREVLIYQRKPIFSFDYDIAISSFSIILSPSEDLSSNILWDLKTTTDTIKPISLENKYRIKLEYGGSELLSNTTYWWQVSVYFQNSSETVRSYFYTVLSEIQMEETLDLQVDFNNPFNPYKNQITKFRYIVKDRNRKAKVRVFNIAGEIVYEFPENLADKDCVYTLEWNGRDKDGFILPTGRYVVSLDAEGVRKSKIVVIVNK